MVEELPETVQEQIASNVIKAKLKAQNGSNRHVENESVQLSTRGSKMKVIINPSAKKDTIFTEESLDNFRVNLGLSQTKMIEATNFLRSHAGKFSVPKHYKEHMKEKSKLLEDLYRSSQHSFECDGGKQELRPVVYADAQELVKAVIEERNFEGIVCIKLMADGGQGFFKISLSVFQENYSATLDRNVNDSEGNNVPLENSKRKSKYWEGGSLGKKGKLLSVKRVLLLCIVPKIKETYSNVRFLFELTEVNISFKFVCDFKLLLINNGQQTATAMYPCPYCFVSLNDLRKCNTEEQAGSSVASGSSDMDNLENSNYMRLKTYGDLLKDYEKFNISGRNLKYAKEYHSTINRPLFQESDDTTVLEKCIIPELHILMGFANHLFWKGLVPLLGEKVALLWPKKLNLVSKSYHGNCFEGNVCRKLLKHADKLNDPDIYRKVGILALMPFINAFKSMDRVVNCCFTSGKVGPGLTGYIEQLSKDFEALQMAEDISETLKIHVMRTHVEQCLTFIENNNGLGYWLEQTGESIHHEFMHIWESYRINSMENKLYDSKLLQAVIEFSSLNI